MKIQIRRSIFETNSSSVHSITMVSGSEYEKWKNGELLYDRLNRKLVTKEEIEKIKESDKKQCEKHNCKFYEYIYDYENYDYYYDYYKEDSYKDLYFRFLTNDKFFDLNYFEYTTFAKSYITNNGEEVVAFGFYGYN